MTGPAREFLARNEILSRRYFLGLGAAGAAAMSALPGIAGEAERDERVVLERDERVAAAIGALETWLTRQDAFRDVSRGKPVPHTLPEEQRSRVGMTRETWKLEVVGDSDHPPRLRSELTVADGTALDFAGLLQLAERHAVRFMKVMTCLNIGCPLGTGLWEGVPLREVLWLTQPRENLRRVFYHGYHNDDPQQLFRSSLPVGRVLEDPFDLPPVILCYKLNGEWLTPERGGPVRVVVPEAYGFKSIKWVNRIVLSNLYHANDTYAGGNNDVDSPLKTFAATLNLPERVASETPLAITGYAQVGISGLSRVQVWLQRDDEAGSSSSDDRYFSQAPWVDAEILPAPADWGAELSGAALPGPIHNFDAETGQPRSWPLRLAKVHWAALLPGQPAGDYTLRCRTIDENGIAQPLPRPFQKSGHAALEHVAIRVTA